MSQGPVHPKRPRAASRLGEAVACGHCGRSLTACREQIVVAQRELVKVRAWLEARTLRLDDLILRLEQWPGDPVRPPAAAGDARPTLVAARTVLRSDGYLDIHLDSMRPFRLPPMLGCLFEVADDTGHEVGDGLVGFKNRGHLVARLKAFARRRPPDTPPAMRAPRFNQARFELRDRLSRFMRDGDRVLETRRGVGFRIRVRKPPRLTGTDRS